MVHGLYIETHNKGGRDEGPLVFTTPERSAHKTVAGCCMLGVFILTFPRSIQREDISYINYNCICHPIPTLTA